MSFTSFYQRSIDDPDHFWANEAKRITWHKDFSQTLDYSRAPFARWFLDGETNLCYNAVDRHLAQRAEQNALIAVSTETNTEKVYSFRELHREVSAMAAMMQGLGVRRGDRVLIYMPMIAEAVFAMLACARIGAVHSVVFGGFAAHSLTSRIDDAQPGLIVSADAGSRGGKVVPYKGLLDEAIRLAQHKPAHVLLVNRGLAELPMSAGRDIDYASLRPEYLDIQPARAALQKSRPRSIACWITSRRNSARPEKRFTSARKLCVRRLAFRKQFSARWCERSGCCAKMSPRSATPLAPSNSHC